MDAFQNRKKVLRGPDVRIRPCRTKGCTHFVFKDRARYSSARGFTKEGTALADGIFCRRCRRKKHQLPSTIRACSTRGCTYRVRTHVRRSGFSKIGVPLADGIFCWYCRRKKRKRREIIKPTIEDERTRFWSKVDKSAGPSKCWPWLCGRDKNGYGKFWMRNGRTVKAHRYAIGLLEPGNSRDDVGKHSCDHPWCCNPAHVNHGTQAANQKEKVERGRSLKGTKHPHAKIDEATALKIKKLRKQGFTYPKIASAFGLTKGQTHVEASRQASRRWLLTPDTAPKRTST